MRFSLIPQAYAADELDAGGVNPTLCDPSQPNLDLGDCLRLSESRRVSEVFDKPSDLVNLFLNNIFVVAGVIIFGMILYAGFLFIQEGEKGKEQAKSIAETALVGFILMFAAYWVVQILQIVTGETLLF